MVTILDEANIEKELAVFLKNQDVFTITERGMTTVTENLTGNGAATTFDLVNPTVFNVRTVVVNSVSQVLKDDYTVDYEGTNPGRVTFGTAPGNTLAVDITYDYSTSGDSIYTDFPRVDLQLNSYPRVSVGISSVRTTPIALGGGAFQSDLMVSITTFANKKNKIHSVATAIRQAVVDNEKSFKYVKTLRPLNVGSVIHDPNRHDKVDQKTDDYIILHEIEK